MSMGFKELDARRALRMNNQDVGSAVDFLVEEKEKRLQIDKEDQRRRREIRLILNPEIDRIIFLERGGNCSSLFDAGTLIFAGSRNLMELHL